MPSRRPTIASRVGRCGIALLLLIAAATLLGPRQHAAAHDLTATVAKVKPSVVGIGVESWYQAPRLVASGFVVADGHHVVTNAHVITIELDATIGEELVVFVGRGREADARQARIVTTDPIHDLALLRIKGAALPALRLGDSGRVAEGQDIAFTGFPIGGVLGLHAATHRGIIAARVPITIPQRQARSLTPRMIRELRDPFVVFQLDAVAYPGNSGSPLYDLEGAVVGVISSVFVKESRERVLQDPSGITYAVPAIHVEDLLEAIAR